MIPKADFIALLHNQPDVSVSFISLLCKKVADKEAQLLHLAYNSVRQRTAEALLKMWQLKKGNEPLGILRDDLAKIVGTATESVIRVLSDFRDEGLIEMEGTKIKLVQPSKLEQVVKWNVAKK
jgi:CRP-like cAMP-binding protein